MSIGARIVTIATRATATVLVLALLVFVADLFAGPFFFVFAKTWPPAPRGVTSIGAIESAIKATDSPAATIHVASGFLGVASTPVLVTAETRIVIGGKLGGFGDLDRGQVVRVAYEVFPDRLVARRIEVLDIVETDPASPSPAAPEPEAAPGRPAALPEPDTTPPAASESQSAAAPEPGTSPTPPASAPGRVAAPSPPAAQSEPAAIAGQRAEPRRPTVVPAAAPAERRARAPKRPVPASASAPASSVTAQPAPAPPRGPQEDGSAAVDWLFTPPR